MNKMNNIVFNLWQMEEEAVIFNNEKVIPVHVVMKYYPNRWLIPVNCKYLFLTPKGKIVNFSGLHIFYDGKEER